MSLQQPAKQGSPSPFQQWGYLNKLLVQVSLPEEIRKLLLMPKKLTKVNWKDRKPWFFCSQDPPKEEKEFSSLNLKLWNHKVAEDSQAAKKLRIMSLQKGCPKKAYKIHNILENNCVHWWSKLVLNCPSHSRSGSEETSFFLVSWKAMDLMLQIFRVFLPHLCPTLL